MSKLIPTANEPIFEEIVRKLRRTEELAKKFGIEWFSIDVSDGTFTPTTVWNAYNDLAGLETKLKIELHLMIADMDARVNDWLIGPVKRVVFHFEAARNPDFVVKKIKDSGREAGIAVNPETSVEKLKPFFNTADTFLVLGVHPGSSGQEMLAGTVDKVKNLREMCSECIIEVDGGVTIENAADLVQAGADYIVAASAIFGGNDIRQAIKNLQTVINKHRQFER